MISFHGLCVLDLLFIKYLISTKYVMLLITSWGGGFRWVGPEVARALAKEGLFRREDAVSPVGSYAWKNW